jgi:hypothetical protein
LKKKKEKKRKKALSLHVFAKKSCFGPFAPVSQLGWRGSEAQSGFHALLFFLFRFFFSLFFFLPVSTCGFALPTLCDPSRITGRGGKSPRL